MPSEFDIGLESFAALSNGKPIPNPRWYRAAEAKLRRAQRKVARRKKGSHRRRKPSRCSKKVHARIWRLRNEFQHIESFKLIRDFGIIVIEQLNVKGLAGGMLSKAVQDAGSKMAYQAESAGRTLIKVDPAGTSQTCLCGATVRKLLSDREHVSMECGLVAPRDLVSAQVILQGASDKSVKPQRSGGAMRGLRSRRIHATEKSRLVHTQFPFPSLPSCSRPLVLRGW
jgi:putative transposase